MAAGALLGHRLRSCLTGLGIAIGVAAVVLLTSIGSGIQRFVLTEFTQFGTRLVAINPGRTQTFGLSGALIGTVRPLSIADADALRRIPGVEAVVPIVQGNAPIEFGKRSRRVTIIGCGPDMPKVFTFRVTLGGFLPHDDSEAPRALVVLGSKVREELFGGTSPLGDRIRVAGERYTVVGVMESKGQVLGFDLDDAVYIPARRSLDMFRRDGLMEIDLVYGAGRSVEELVGSAERLLVARHGQLDFQIKTQQQMLDVLDSILGVLTFAVGALGGVSLLVGGVGILTITMIAVTERTSEIGLLRALGAERGHVLAIFLVEAAGLGAAGGAFGLFLGLASARLVDRFVPGLPVHTPWGFALMAEGVAVLIGLVAGILPARRAARRGTLEAQRAE